MDEIKTILNFLHFSEKLKNEFRKGFTSEEKKESVAAHCWRVSLFVMLSAPYLDKKINIEKALKLAVIHDLVEIVTGDIPCFKYENDIEKENEIKTRERAAILEITKRLPKELQSEFYTLWCDFEDSLSYESKFVKALDKIEAQIQHNEMDFSHWNEFDLNYAKTGLNKYCDFDIFLKKIKTHVQEESKNKIAENTK